MTEQILAVRLRHGQTGVGPTRRESIKASWPALAGPSTIPLRRRRIAPLHDDRLQRAAFRPDGLRPSPANLKERSAPLRPGYLVCLDLAAEGRLLWKIAPEEGWAFEGSPVADDRGVYVAMRRHDIRPQAFVACFDADTGRLRWRRFVCGAETPARGVLPEYTHNLLTLSGGTLYYNTNLGAVAALRADDGRVLWVSLYPRALRGDLAKLAPHWRRDLNPCVFDRGTLLVAPADSPRIFAFDAADRPTSLANGDRGRGRRPTCWASRATGSSPAAEGSIGSA